MNFDAWLEIVLDSMSSRARRETENDAQRLDMLKHDFEEGNDPHDAADMMEEAIVQDFYDAQDPYNDYMDY